MIYSAPPATQMVLMNPGHEVPIDVTVVGIVTVLPVISVIVRVVLAVDSFDGCDVVSDNVAGVAQPNIKPAARINTVNTRGSFFI